MHSVLQNSDPNHWKLYLSSDQSSIQRKISNEYSSEVWNWMKKGGGLNAIRGWNNKGMIQTYKSERGKIKNDCFWGFWT